jgi:spore coat polysaccharide biosynthesis protein SpsF
MIGWIAERLRACKEVDEIVVGTTQKSQDDAIALFAKREKLLCFRGSEEDLIDRLYGTAREHGADALVRITGDCPFVDPDVVDELVRRFRHVGAQVDYVTNNFPPTFPHGLDAEVWPTPTLGRLWREIQDPYYREWFPLYVKERDKNPFRILNVSSPVNLSDLRWTVDYPEDLVFARRVFRSLGGLNTVFRMSDVLALIRRRPEIKEINISRLERHAASP